MAMIQLDSSKETPHTVPRRCSAHICTYRLDRLSVYANIKFESSDSCGLVSNIDFGNQESGLELEDVRPDMGRGAAPH